MNIIAAPAGRRRIHRLDHTGAPIALTLEEIRGLPGISYLRFSSKPQEKGSTIDRQVETRDRIVAYFQLVLDRTIEDRAKSASKGHHRTVGNLAVLLEAAQQGLFLQNPTVLIVEAMDRLFREGALDVFAVLKIMMEAGLIVVTGDGSIWCEVSVNGPGNHKLLAEVNAAKLYTDRLAQLARGAHETRRKKLAKLAENPEAPRPLVNGRLPGWIIRTEDRAAPYYPYDLCPIHWPTVVRIYSDAASGFKIREITARLIADGVPRMRWSKDGPERPWTRTRVGAILKDPLVLGYKRPMKWVDGRRVDIAPKVRLFPPAVDAGLYKQARDMLTARKGVLTGHTGGKGGPIPNLFTRRAFCPDCGNALRVFSGGHPAKKRGGKAQRTLVCGAWIESKACTNRQRYDLWHFEKGILTAILALTELAPPRISDEGMLKSELAALEVEIAQQEETLAFLQETLNPRSETSKKGYMAQVAKIDGLREKADALRIEAEAAGSSGSRSADAWDTIKATIQPAVAGDGVARERLRGLLAKLDFRITGGPAGHLIVSAGGRSIDIAPEAEIDRPERDADTEYEDEDRFEQDALN